MPKLTKTAVDRITRPEKGQTFTWDSELRGFGVRATPSGLAYIAQARATGKTRRVTIGSHGKYTTDEARKKARTLLADMSNGIDPAAEKRRQQALDVTLADVAASYLENRRTKGGLPLKDSTRSDVKKHLRGAFKDWKDRPVVSITRDAVAKRYAARCKTSPAQANQAMRILGALIRYAAATYRTPDGVRVIADNPVDVLREANMWRDVEARTSMVPLDQIGGWWAAVEDRRTDPALTTSSRAAADLVAFLLLTGLRLGEARNLKWVDVDLDDKSFCLPNPKNRRGITLPLSDAAVALLEGRRNASEWVFPARSGNGPLKDCRGQLEALADDTGIRITPHDLRRTFIQIGLKALGMELWRIKALSNHKLNQDVTLNAYANLSDVRFLRTEANQIGAYFQQQASANRAGNVVPIRPQG